MVKCEYKLEMFMFGCPVRGSSSEASSTKVPKVKSPPQIYRRRTSSWSWGGAGYTWTREV